MKIKPFRPHGDLVKIAMQRLYIPHTVIPPEVLQIADRAGGGCICDRCGLKYYDHPQIDGHPDMYLICNWEVYKL